MGETLSKESIDPCACCSGGPRKIGENTTEFPGQTLFAGFVKEDKEKPVIVGDLSLSQAVFRGDTDFVQAKLQIFADYTKEQDVDLNTPVHWAAVKGHREILQILLKNNFPASKPNKDGCRTVRAYPCLPLQSNLMPALNRKT